MSGSLDFTEICAKLRQAPNVDVIRDDRSAVDEDTLVRMAASEHAITAPANKSLQDVGHRNSPLLLELVNYQYRGRRNAPADVRSATDSTRYGARRRVSMPQPRACRQRATPRNPRRVSQAMGACA